MGKGKSVLRSSGQYTWVIVSLVFLTLTPLLATSFWVVDHQHNVFLNDMRLQTRRELQLLSFLIQNYPASGDQAILETKLLSWCRNHPEISSFVASFDDGSFLAQYQSEKETRSVLAENRIVSVPGKKLLTIQVRKCANVLENQQRQLLLGLILLSVLVTSSLGIILWFAFRKWTFTPLKEEIRSRKKVEIELQNAYRTLEDRVQQRTVELEHVNVRLREEVEERKKAEMEMGRTNRYNELLLKSAGEGLFGIDTEGLISFVNPEAVRLLMYQEDELLGRDPHALLHHTKADGKPYAKDACPIFSSTKDGREFKVSEELFWRKDGKSFEVEYVSTPVVENETVIGAVVVFRDVSTRKIRETEKKKLQSQLLHAQKMESVGRLAGGVAHDFNNLLTTIIGYVDLTRLTCGKDLDSTIQKNLQIVKSTCEKAAALVRQLLAFSRKQELEMKPVNLGGLLEDLSKMLRRLIGEDIKFTLENGSSSLVFADSSQLEQVFMNLAINARDAMPRGGSLTIETSEVNVDESITNGHVGTLPGKYVLVKVTDTGEGMSLELQQSIFEPFFTTKEIGKGTGLGLATVFGIIEQHKGIIQVGSTLKEGTTFSVYLPVTERSVIDIASEKKKFIEAQEAFRGSETILVVDDEKDLCDLVAKTLAQLGYTVMQANSGDEAIAKLNDHNEKIDLLLTDMVMPGMNGSELARRLGYTRRMMKVLYMSGYPADVVEEHGVFTDRGDHFMQKPFNPDQLIDRVRTVLKE